ASEELGTGGEISDDRGKRITRAQSQCAAGRYDAVLAATDPGQHLTVISERGSEVRVERERLFELGQRILQAPIVHVSAGEPEMRPGVLAVGADRRQGRSLRFLDGDYSVLPAHIRAQNMAGGEDGERLRIVWVDFNRLLKQPLSRGIVLA